MITLKSNADNDVTLVFYGEEIIVTADKPFEVKSQDEADFVLETLSFCEVVDKKEKASVPEVSVPKPEVKEDIKKKDKPEVEKTSKK